MPDPIRVVVTRTPDQASAFSQKLRQAGFVPVEFPAIMLQPLPPEPLDAALAELATFDWLIFTSGNAVEFFFNGRHIPPSQLPNVAASGSATAEKLAARGITITFVPEEFVGEKLVTGLGELAGKRVLLPRAKKGRPEIVRLLAQQGADVVEVPLYDTVTAVPTPAQWQTITHGFEAVTFTSPSSVRNFLKLVASRSDVQQWLETAVIVCIGPITAETAVTNGLTAIRVPDEYTTDGMVTELTRYFKVKEETN